MRRARVGAAAVVLVAVYTWWVSPVGAQPAPQPTLTGQLACDGATGSYLVAWRLDNPTGQAVDITSAATTGLDQRDTFFLPDPVPADSYAVSQSTTSATTGGTITMTAVTTAGTLAATVTIPAGLCIPTTVVQLSGAVTCLASGDRLVTWTATNPSDAPVVLFTGHQTGLVTADLTFEPSTVPAGATATTTSVVAADLGAGQLVLRVGDSVRGETLLGVVDVPATACPVATTATTAAAGAVGATPSFTG